MNEIRDMEKMAEHHAAISDQPDPMSGFKRGDVVLRKKSASGVYEWHHGRGPFNVTAAESGHLNFEFATGWYLASNFELVDPCPDCGAPIEVQPLGGAKCSKCDYWFCVNHDKSL